MKNEFDFENEELEFEDLGFEDLHEDAEITPDELDELFEASGEDFEELVLEEIEMRTAVLSKNNMVALLCIKTADQGGAICRVDPRENQPSVQVYDDPVKALEWFNKSIRTSKKNGWQVVYNGLPLQG